MVKFSLSVFLQLTISTSAFAQATLAQAVQKEKWEGYKLVTDVDFQSDSIKRFANNNVLQLVTAGSTNGFTEDPTTYEVTYEPFEIVNTDQQPVVTDRSILNSEPRAFQIETCRKQNLKRCPVTSAIRTTLFVNQGKYWSCRHSFHNWLYHASKENHRPFNTISPPIKLRQPRKDDPAKFQTVYNSAFPDEKLLQMGFIQTDERANILYYEHQADTLGTLVVPYDIVLMIHSQNNTLEQDHSLPELPGDFSTNLSSKSEVYIMGYAAQTNVFHGQGDAPGDRLVVSNGFIDNTSVQSENPFFSTSNYSTGGISGSPIVSADGTLLGIVCHSDVKVATNPASAHTFPMSINTDFLNSLWVSYGYPPGDVPTSQAALGK